MITARTLRDQGMGPDPLCVLEKTSTEALKSLVVDEISFGCYVDEISPTRVVVVTRLPLSLNKDIVIFEGPKEEMELIVNVAAAHIYLKGVGAVRDAIVNRASDFLKGLPQGIGGRAGYISMLTPFLTGGPLAATALLLGIGITDEDAITSLKQLKLKDLVIAVELHLETGTPIMEVVNELALAAK